MELTNEIIIGVDDFGRFYIFKTKEDKTVMVNLLKDDIKIKIDPKISGTLLSFEITPKFKHIITLTVRNKKQKEGWQKSIRKRRDKVKREKEKLLKTKPRDITPP